MNFAHSLLLRNTSRAHSAWLLGRRLLLTSVGLIALLSESLVACSVPVFRYALEHWHSDPYRVIVFHRGEFTEPQRTLIEQLQADSIEGRTAVNLDVETVDVEGELDEELAALWKEHQGRSLPRVVVQPPVRHGPRSAIWAGELSEESIAQLIESPVRTELRRRIVAGDSVVWLFLESGDREVDDAAYATIEREISRLESVLELPPIEEADLKDLSVEPETLRLKMSSLRVARDDPMEEVLVGMLLRVEPDLLEEQFVHQPMAFPIFGRGRVLYALVGDGITPQTIEEASRFLTGACQCTVKAQNPGVDLLMSAEWDQLIVPALPYDDTPPVLAGLAGFSLPESDNSATGDIGETAAPPAAATEGEEKSDSDDTGPVVPNAEDERGAAAGVLRSSDVPADTATAEDDNVVRNVLLVMGVLTLCVIVASVVLIPRSR